MCKHEHMKAVSMKVFEKRKELLFCLDCGEELPIDFLTAGNGLKKPSEAGEGEKVNKSPRRKRTAKNGE